MGWLMLMSFCAFALESYGQEMNSARGELSSEGFSRTDFHGEVQWEAVQYLIALPETEHLNSSQFLSADFDFYRQSSSLTLKFDLSAGSFVEFGSSTFTAAEAYIATGSALPNWQVSFGRKRLPWNLLDQEWQLGVYQPVYDYDVIHPEVQGLSGFFLESSHGSWRWAARVSPVFIPSQGAPIEEGEGKLRAPTRFFRPPSASTILIGQPTGITYDLEVPPFDELLRHPGYSLLLGYGDPLEEGVWGQLSFSDKPNPKLLINFKGLLTLTEEEGGRPQGDVTVSPYVSYHRVYSADVGVAQGGYRAWVSVLADEPYGEFYKEGWTRQEISPLTAYALHFSFLTWAVKGVQGRGELAYLQVQGAESSSENSATEGDAALFGDRAPYTSAARLRLSSGLAEVFGRPLSTELKWLWDFEEGGLLMSTELQYLYQESVALLVGVDIIGTPGGSEENNSPAFLNEYRSNDRVYGGLSYVF